MVAVLNAALAAANCRYVYDRLLFDTEFSFESFQSALKAQGFSILEARDFSEHLKTSYLCLSERTPKKRG